jgi:hypothetical protein
MSRAGRRHERESGGLVDRLTQLATGHQRVDAAVKTANWASNARW